MLKKWIKARPFIVHVFLLRITRRGRLQFAGLRLYLFPSKYLPNRLNSHDNVGSLTRPCWMLLWGSNATRVERFKIHWAWLTNRITWLDRQKTSPRVKCVTCIEFDVDYRPRQCLNPARWKFKGPAAKQSVHARTHARSIAHSSHIARSIE